MVVPFIALLGLIWGSGQILRIALSHQHRERLSALIGIDLVAWAIFVQLALNTPAIPSQIGEWLALAISAVFVVYLCYQYLYKTKKTRALKHETANHAYVVRASSRVRLGNTVAFMMSCIVVVWSAYLLYSTGYLSGEYNGLVTLAKIMNITRTERPELTVQLSRGVYTSIIGIATGIVGFAVVAYGSRVLGRLDIYLKARPKHHK